ncbi:hypothetical protein BGZ80_002864, partial [Entomortierella chlamydospora]
MNVTFGNVVEGQKTRFTFAEKHVAKLEKVFKTEQYPNRALKAELSEFIGCSEKQVANWFDRRRIFERKTNQASANPINTSSSPSGPSVPQNGPSPSPVPSVEEDTPTDGVLGTAAFTENNSPQPKSAPVPSKLSSNKIAHKLTRLTQGNVIRKPSDVKAAIELMEEAGDSKGRIYILNTLISTKRLQPILKEFVRLKGHGLLSDWMVEAREDPGTPENRDLMRKTIEVLNELPLELDDIMVRGVGKVMNRIARNKDETVDKDTSERAAKVVKKWKDLVQGPAGSSSGSKPNGDRNGRGVKRERDDAEDRLHESTSRSLPKFNKGTPVGPAETIKKPNIVENTSFFDQLRGRPSNISTSSSTSTTNSSSTKPSSSPVSTTPVATITSPAQPSPAPATSVSKENTEAASDNVPSITEATTAPTPAEIVDTPMNLPLQHSPAAETAGNTNSSDALGATPSTDMEMDTVAADPPKKGKGKRVWWKADHELVAIRFIEPRGEVLEHEEEEVEALVRGDMWRPPPLLQLDAGCPERGSKSVEKGVQEQRESETLSVNYLQIAYIPPSPAEPDPEPIREGTINTAAVLAALSAVATARSNANAT